MQFKKKHVFAHGRVEIISNIYDRKYKGYEDA